MATTSEVNGWADVALESAEALLEDIQDRALDWDTRPEDERADFFLEWEDIVRRLEEAADDDRAGLLMPDRRRRLRSVARLIVAARPQIEAMGLDIPSLDLLALAS